MTVEQDRMALLGRLSKQANIREKAARLTELAGFIPEFQATLDRTRETAGLWGRMLGERDDILLSQAEGRNAEVRRAALLALRQEDKDYQQILNTLNGVRGELIQASLDLEKLKREWVVLVLQAHVFTATLGFLAGASEKGAGINHDGEA